MPAKSVKQQKLMGMVYALKKGALKLKDLPDALADKVKSIAKSMTTKEAKMFAGTKHKGLPTEVKETFDISFKDFITLDAVLTESEINDIYQVMERVCPKTGKYYEDEEHDKHKEGKTKDTKHNKHPRKHPMQKDHNKK